MRLSLARIISLIFNPIAIAFFAPFFLVYKTTHDISIATHWTMYTLVFLMALSFFAIIGVKKKIFTDLDVSKREQRPVMYLVSIICCAIYLASLFFLHGPYILYILTIGVIIGVSFLSIINRRIKASIHVAAITSLILPVAVSYGHYYLLLLFLIPLVIWARLKTKRHTLPEIVVGGTIGGILSLSIYLAAKIFFNK